MNDMKKILNFFLALLLSMSLVACASTKKQENAGVSEKNSEEIIELSKELE
jgi:ABC-type oligopeptide transport system substrate-binding subunit